MNAMEQLKKFKKEFLDLTRAVANAGVPIQNLILELEMEKFRFQAVLLQRTAELEARELADKIIAAPPGLDLKTPRNGERP